MTEFKNVKNPYPFMGIKFERLKKIKTKIFLQKKEFLPISITKMDEQLEHVKDLFENSSQKQRIENFLQNFLAVEACSFTNLEKYTLPICAAYFSAQKQLHLQNQLQQQEQTCQHYSLLEMNDIFLRKQENKELIQIAIKFSNTLDEGDFKRQIKLNLVIFLRNYQLFTQYLGVSQKYLKNSKHASKIGWIIFLLLRENLKLKGNFEKSVYLLNFICCQVVQKLNEELITQQSSNVNLFFKNISYSQAQEFNKEFIQGVESLTQHWNKTSQTQINSISNEEQEHQKQFLIKENNIFNVLKNDNEIKKLMAFLIEQVDTIFLFCEERYLLASFPSFHQAIKNDDKTSNTYQTQEEKTEIKKQDHLKGNQDKIYLQKIQSRATFNERNDDDDDDDDYGINSQRIHKSLDIQKQKGINKFIEKSNDSFNTQKIQEKITFIQVNTQKACEKNIFMSQKSIFSKQSEISNLLPSFNTLEKTEEDNQSIMKKQNEANDFKIPLQKQPLQQQIPLSDSQIWINQYCVNEKSKKIDYYMNKIQSNYEENLMEEVKQTLILMFPFTTDTSNIQDKQLLTMLEYEKQTEASYEEQTSDCIKRRTYFYFRNVLEIMVEQDNINYYYIIT